CRRRCPAGGAGLGPRRTCRARTGRTGLPARQRRADPGTAAGPARRPLRRPLPAKERPMQQASPQPSRGRRALAWTRAEVLPLLALVLLMLVARSSFANHYHVPSGSMQPTLQPGDRVAVDMRAYGWPLPFTTRDLVQVRDPVPGEVVVFSSPQDGTRLIKRLVAVGGDTVEVADGRLRINGEALASGPLRAVELFPGRSVPLDLRHGGGPDVALF